MSRSVDDKGLAGGGEPATLEALKEENQQLRLASDQLHAILGTIEAASGGVGQGSTFTLKLPVMIVHQGASADVDRAHKARQSPRRSRRSARTCAASTCWPSTTMSMR